MAAFPKLGRVRDYLFGVYESTTTSSDPDDDLSDLVHGFIEAPDCTDGQATAVGNEDEDDEVDLVDSIDLSVLSPDSNQSDLFCMRLRSDVLRAVDRLRSNRPDDFRRALAAALRECGYNAAVCRTRWEGSKGLVAGSYEFLDVYASTSPENAASAAGQRRYIVDPDFASQFEIARPTEEFSAVIRSLQGVLVGRAEEVKAVVRAASEAAKRSMRKRGLHLPPWRSYRYMQNKWLSGCRRTSHHLPPAGREVVAVNCRAVGLSGGPSVVNRRFARV